MQDDVTLESVPGFDRPMTAGPNDRVVGEDELGRRVYETQTGQRYTLSLNPDQRTTRTRVEEDIIPAMQEYLENPSLPDLPTVSEAAGMLGNAARSTYDVIEGQVQGRGTLGDVLGSATLGAGSTATGLRSVRTPDISTQRVSPTFNTKLFDDEDFGVALPSAVAEDYTPAPMYIEGFDFLTPEEGFLDLKRITEQNAKDFDESTILGSLARDRLKIFDNFSQEELFDVAKGLPHFNDPNYVNYLRQNIAPLSSRAKVSTENFLELVNDISSYFPAKPDPMRENVSERFLPYRSPIGQRAFPESLPAPSDSRAEALGFEDIVYHSSISPEEFAEFDLDKGFGSQVRNSQDLLGVHVGTARAAAERNLQASFFDPVGFTMELRARTDKPFNRQALGELFTAEEIEDIQRRNPRDDFSPDSPFTENELSGLVNAYERKMFEGEILPENSRELAAIALRRDLAFSEFTHIPYMNDVEDPGSTSFIMLVDRPRTSPAVLRDVRAQFDPDQITNPDLRFAEGGVVSMEEQMSLFDMGGLADDGAMRDPVSGNEVPPGSMASEVRDDVPAMLSEGEYIVPADVVRFFGVKFFEDLRNQAKSGLMDMERGGRIGGEPVGAPEDDLTPEEMQMLAEITGMAMGGMVKGYQTGGMVNQPFTPTPNYNVPGFSLFQPSQAAATTPATPVQTTTATLYGPNGEIVTLTLPTEQARYDALLGQGYSTQQKSTQPVVQGGDTSGGSDEEDFIFNAGDSDRGPKPLKADMYEALNTDPLAYGQSMLEKQDFSRIAGGIGSLALGPAGGLVSGAVAAGFTANNVAQAKAAVEIAKARGLDTTELEKNINSYVSSLPNAARAMANLATGENIVARFNAQSGESAVAPTATTPPRPPTAGGGQDTNITERPTVDPFAGMTAAELLPPPREDNRDRERTTSWDTGPETARKEAAEKVARAEGTFREDGTFSRTTPEGKETFASKVARGGGFKKGGLVAKPDRKKPVAKKK